MLNVDEQPKLPRYELKVGGETKSYDSLILGYGLKGLEGIEDPSRIQATVNSVFAVEVDSFTASVILKDFFDFAERELEEPLKNVFGRELFSTTTTDSVLPNSTD